MRILGLAQSLQPTNGWGRYARELALSMRELGIEFDVWLERGQDTGDAPPSHPRLQLRGQDLPSITAAALEGPRLAAAARKYDLVHALDETKLPLAAAISLGANRPFVASLHGSHGVRLLTKRGAIYRPLLARSRRLFAASRYTRTRVLEMAEGLDAKISVVPLGVREVLLDPPKAADRKPIALSLGAPKARKGVREALAAVIQLRALNPGLTLYVAGSFDAEDPYVASLKADAQQAGAPEALNLLGRISDEEATSLLNSARALLMPSQTLAEGFEGFGLVHLEAAARGLPTIGSRGSGNEDAIQDGVTGFLVAQNDAEDVMGALSLLLSDDRRWDRMSAAAIAFARHKTWRRTAELTLEGYGL